MDNYSNNYLINSFGHEFNENFAESYDQHDQHQSKTDYEIPLQSSIFGYDEMGTTHQDANIWNDDQSGYMVYQNYFENQNLTDISDSTNIANSMQLYPNESIEFISNRSSDFENPVMLPFIDNIEAIETPSERSSTQFCCNETNCNKTYASLSGLNNHIKKKHSVTAATASFHCDECNATFMTPQQRTVHKIKEHNGRKCQVAKQKNCIKDTEKNVKSNEIQLNKCQLCDDTFNHKADLVRHMRNRHTGSGEYPCSKCSKVFFTFDMYNEHLKLHDESVPKHTCDDCGKEFISQRKLKEHSIIHKERIMFKCEMCSKIFVRSQTLQYHRITCKAAYQCKKCVDSFMTAEALEKHEALHKTDTFTCLKCNKVFATLHALQNHDKRHSLRMNYTCQICNEKVSTSAKFQKHIKDHLETNLKCSACNEEFQSLVKYGYHKAEMHGIMRPYDCVLCSDEFCTRHELFVHLHNHIDVSGSYACDLCGIKFSIKATYEQHKKSHLKDSDQTMSDSTDIPAEINQVDESKPVEEKNQIPNVSKDMANSSLKSQELTCRADGCDITFSTHKQLKKHQSIHKLAAYNCPKCKKTYHSNIVYETHVRLCMPECEDVVLVADDDIDSGPVECAICSQLFENKKVLRFHEKICNDANDDEMKDECAFNQEIEEIYLKTEIEEELSNLVPEF